MQSKIGFLQTLLSKYKCFSPEAEAWAHLFQVYKRSKKSHLAVFLNPLLFPAFSEKYYLPVVCQATTPPHAVIWGKKKQAQVWQIFQVDKGQQEKPANTELL